MQKPSARIDDTIRNSQNMVVMHGNIFQDIAKILDELHERLKKVEEVRKADEREKEVSEATSRIRTLLFAVGAPLNDNVLNFNKEQRNVLHSIWKEVESLITEQT